MGICIPMLFILANFVYISWYGGKVETQTYEGKCQWCQYMLTDYSPTFLNSPLEVFSIMRPSNPLSPITSVDTRRRAYSSWLTVTALAGNRNNINGCHGGGLEVEARPHDRPAWPVDVQEDRRGRCRFSSFNFATDLLSSLSFLLSTRVSSSFPRFAWASFLKNLAFCIIDNNRC